MSIPEIIFTYTPHQKQNDFAISEDPGIQDENGEALIISILVCIWHSLHFILSVENFGGGLSDRLDPRRTVNKERK